MAERMRNTVEILRGDGRSPYEYLHDIAKLMIEEDSGSPWMADYWSCLRTAVANCDEFVKVEKYRERLRKQA